MVLGLEVYGALQVAAPCAEVEQPDHYLLVGDAEGDGLAVERMLILELPDLGRQEVMVGDLSIENRPGVKPVIADAEVLHRRQRRRSGRP